MSDTASRLAVMLNSGRWPGVFDLIQAAISELRRLESENKQLRQQVASLKRKETLACSSAVERLPVKERVAGSIPAAPAKTWHDDIKERADFEESAHRGDYDL